MDGVGDGIGCGGGMRRLSTSNSCSDSKGKSKIKSFCTTQDAMEADKRYCRQKSSNFYNTQHRPEQAITAKALLQNRNPWAARYLSGQNEMRRLDKSALARYLGCDVRLTT